MEGSISTSASTIRMLHMPYAESSSAPISQTSSPRSSALPSPPDSPSSDSVSSLPSVSSSFFFSSGAPNSPQHSDDDDEQEQEPTQGLIIPSLVLPPALRQPTNFGKTVGDIRIIVIAGSGAGPSFTTKLLLEDNEDIVDFDPWEQLEYGRMLRASTDWEAQHDPHGQDNYEPARNIEILELPGYSQNDSVSAFAERVKDLVHTPFHSISDVIMPSAQPLSVAASLVSSPTTPLYTALIMVVPSAATPFEESLIHQLSPHIPVVLFSRPSTRFHHRHIIKNLTAFRPTSTAALRTGLFRSPDTLSALRSEAADRFLRWREIEHTAVQLQLIRQRRRKSSSASFSMATATHSWSKSEWEAEWERRMSRDVGLSDNGEEEEEDEDEVRRQDRDEGAAGLPFDPLHFPSLLLFSMSLLSPLKDTIQRSTRNLFRSFGSWNVRLAILGGFFIGLGAGIIYG